MIKHPTVPIQYVLSKTRNPNPEKEFSTVGFDPPV